MKAETILEKHWRNFRMAVGLTYEPMTARAKEHLLLAMDEFAKLANGVDTNPEREALIDFMTYYNSQIGWGDRITIDNIDNYLKQLGSN